jgi:hypothetical protein
MKHSMASEGDLAFFSVSSFIIMQWLHNGKVDGCLTFEIPSPAYVFIGFKEYRSTIQSMNHHSLTHPTEKVSLWYHFNRLRHSSCGHSPKMCFVLIKYVTSNHFISFSKVSLRGKIWNALYTIGGKRMYLWKHPAHYVFKFTQRGFFISSSVVLHIFWCGIWSANSGEDSLCLGHYSKWSVLYKLVYGYECSVGKIWVCLHSLPENKGTLLLQKLCTHAWDYTVPWRRRLNINNFNFS